MMRTRTRRKREFLFLLCISLLFASCTDQWWESGDRIYGDSTIRFNIDRLACSHQIRRHPALRRVVDSLLREGAEWFREFRRREERGEFDTWVEWVDAIGQCRNDVLRDQMPSSWGDGPTDDMLLLTIIMGNGPFSYEKVSEVIIAFDPADTSRVDLYEDYWSIGVSPKDTIPIYRDSAESLFWYEGQG